MIQIEAQQTLPPVLGRELGRIVKHAIETIVLGLNHVVPVKVPAPERFVLHKLMSSQQRKTDRAKVRKDLEQAAVLAAVLTEDNPGILEDTLRALPSAGRPDAKRGARAAAKLIEGAHAEGHDVLAVNSFCHEGGFQSE